LTVTNVGKEHIFVNGEPKKSRASLAVGDVLLIGNLYAFLLIEGPALAPGPRLRRAPEHPLGEPDADGIIGESLASWELRHDIVCVAATEEHVLILGPSGSGKTAVAKAIHRRSRRSKGPFIEKSAPTLTESLVNAELFGHPKNFPNAGMSERKGLIGAADKGTLFLDEIGRMAAPSQGSLLAALDKGNYTRMGEDITRHSDLRLICATNADPKSLTFDFVPRLKERICVPPLDARPEDIPLLARAWVLEHAKKSPDDAERFVYEEVVDGKPRACVRFSPQAITELVQRRYELNVRELDGLLLQMCRASEGDTVRPLPRKKVAVDAEPPSKEDEEATLKRAISVLDENSWNITAAARTLGMSRTTLFRLLKRAGRLR
jgi:two-component system nitrogen regulation response regulator GlnG/two-component system response regulator HydG